MNCSGMHPFCSVIETNIPIFESQYQEQLDPKQLAGRKAAEFIEEGMTIGLGTGTTAYHTIVRVGEMVRDGLNIRTVYTSLETRDLATKHNIPCLTLGEAGHIDLTIDGADEIDPRGNGIKGGRGALLYEKIIASASSKNVWVVSEQKLVDNLGAFPLPVEVIPLASGFLMKRFTELEFSPVLRKSGNDAYLTDSKNYIVDLHLGEIDDPEYLGAHLKTFPGVVEHGLFLDTCNAAVVATNSDTRVIEFR